MSHKLFRHSILSDARVWSFLKRVDAAEAEAWVERDYHRRVHRELGTTPLTRLLDSVDASRPSPGSDDLKAAFRISMTRRQRRSDATVSIEGVRYQIPAPWRHLSELHLRAARWDLSSVELVDGRNGERLCTVYPLDRRGNADGLRRNADPGGNRDGGSGAAAEAGPAPLLRRILDDQAASGLPPLWLPHAEPRDRNKDDEQGDPS